MFRFIPREAIFFQLFESAAENVNSGATLFAKLLESFLDVPGIVARLKEHEHRGDQITHETLNRVNGSFVTPIEREDIHALMSRLDDVIDLIDSAASLLILYKISHPTPEAVAMGRVLAKAAATVERAIRGLRSLRKPEEILNLCVEVHTHENEGDRLHHAALGCLFDDDHPVLDVIKWKDIYSTIEEATNRCEDVANILEGIVLKNV